MASLRDIRWQIKSVKNTVGRGPALAGNLFRRTREAPEDMRMCPKVPLPLKSGRRHVPARASAQQIVKVMKFLRYPGLILCGLIASGLCEDVVQSNTAWVLMIGDFHGQFEIKDDQGKTDVVDTNKRQKEIHIPRSYYYADCEDGPECSYIWIDHPRGSYGVRYTPKNPDGKNVLSAILTRSVDGGPRDDIDRLCIELPHTPLSVFDILFSSGSLKFVGKQSDIKVVHKYCKSED